MARKPLYPNGETKKFNMLIKKSHWDELEELAGYEGKSVSQLIRQLVSDFLKDRKESRRMGGTDGRR